MKKICDFSAFKEAVESLFSDISIACAKCEYPECKGWVWLFDSEVGRLNAHGIETMRINGENGPAFLSLIRCTVNGDYYLDQQDTRCRLRASDGSCTIHEIKPLVCSLYPLAVDVLPEDRSLVWTLHVQCEYVQRQNPNGMIILKENLMNLLEQLDIHLEKRLWGVLAKSRYMWDPETLKNEYILLRRMRSFEEEV